MADDDQVLTEVTEAEEAAAAEPEVSNQPAAEESAAEPAADTPDSPVVEEVTEVAGEPVADDAA